MADTNSLNEEKKGLTDQNESATVDIDQDESTVKFINGGKGIDKEDGSADVSFTGLGKEELLKYADDPFWKKVRIVLFIFFWVGWLAMLVAAIIIIVLAPRCPYRPDTKWYDENSAYQVYPKSFKDSTSKESAEAGAGVGDLKGIQSKLSYFEDIGVKTLYISSLYKSGGQDNGMDVVNHKDIDPIFGTMQDFDALQKATKNKMRLILDFIPNHTSRNHTWFESSRRKEAPYADYYIWAPCTSTTKPNDWVSVYDATPGSAWEYDSVRQECYYHRYLKEEPDLNLGNDDVKREMETIIRFWFDKGVDGFNIIGAENLVETNNTNANEPQKKPESIALISSWRSIADSYATKPGKERMIMVTATGNINETKEFYGSGNTKGANFVIISPVDTSSTLSAANIEARIKEYTASDATKWAWSFGNQDEPRLATKTGPEKVKAMLAIQMLLPGMPVNYYGNELGMKDGVVSFDERQDILVKDITEAAYSTAVTRDPYRTPMQWTSGSNAGFSVNKPWLPVNSDFATVNVESQDAYFSDRMMDETPLHAFRNLTELREKESFQWGATTVGTFGESLWFKRHAEGFPGFVVVANLGTASQTLKMHEVASVPSQLELVFHSEYRILPNVRHLNFEEKAVSVGPNQVLVFQYE